MKQSQHKFLLKSKHEITFTLELLSDIHNQNCAYNASSEVHDSHTQTRVVIINRLCSSCELALLGIVSQMDLSWFVFECVAWCCGQSAVFSFRSLWGGLHHQREMIESLSSLHFHSFLLEWINLCPPVPGLCVYVCASYASARAGLAPLQNVRRFHIILPLEFIC